MTLMDACRFTSLEDYLFFFDTGFVPRRSVAVQCNFNLPAAI